MTRARWMVLLVLLGFLPQAACNEDLTRKDEEHVLNRIGYGPDPWSKTRIRQLGVAGYIEEQLHPETLDDSQLEADLNARYPTLSMGLIPLRLTYHEYGAPNGGVGQPRKELSLARLTRAVRSKRQLEQALTDFWFNHFNVDASVGYSRWAASSYERDVIRPHVFGRFEDMLMAVAKHPAMLDYLDNAVNFLPGFRAGTRTYGYNENFGREILELHTLGVDAPYTLTDIQEVARAFTGWTYGEVLSAPLLGTVGFVYADAGHDKGAKSILGGALQIPAGGGIEDGEAVVRFLARHHLTAERVARKLCQRFVSETPSQTLVNQAKQTYLSTDGDLRAVMRTILTSTAFRESSARRTKVKRPFVFVTSTARAVGLADEQSWANNTLSELKKMGETPYEAAPPTGYPEASGAWVAHGPFMSRVNYAHQAGVANYGFAPLGSIPGTSAEIVDTLAPRLVWGGITPAERSAVISVVDGHNTATEVRYAGSTLLVTPSFVMH